MTKLLKEHQYIIMYNCVFQRILLHHFKINISAIFVQNEFRCGSSVSILNQSVELNGMHLH